MPLYNLNKKSNNIIDQIKILENCEEIHLIDSSYSVLIYFLSFKNELLKSKKIFLHRKAVIGFRDLLIYVNPKPDNWVFI